MLLHIYGITYTILYVVMCKIFLETFAKKRFDRIEYIIMLLLGLSALEYICSIMLAEWIVLKTFVVILMDTVVMWSVFREKLLRVLVLILMYQGLCFGSDFISWILLNHVLALFAQEYLFVPAMQIFMGIFSQVFLFCILLLIKKCFEKQDSSMFTDLEWVCICIFPVFTMVSVIGIIIYFDASADAGKQNVLLCIAFGMLIMNIFVFNLIGDILKREKKLREEALFRKRVRSGMDMYRQISDNYDRQRRREHEYRNQMMVIASFVRDKKLESLERYMKNWNGKTEYRADFFDANHAIVNAILNTKYQEAKEKGIVFVVKINDLSRIQMEDEDLVIILSNLLNNAIEACELCRYKEIKFKFVKAKEQIIISVINTFVLEPVMADGEYQTTKADKTAHGIGIRNVRETIRKYNGSCVMKHDKNKFWSVIVIPEK